MGAADLVRKGRAAALKYMRATGTEVTVGRNTGALDPVTFEPVITQVYPDPSWPDDHPLKDGPARVQTYEPVQTGAEVGGGSATVQRYSVHIPVGFYNPEVDDVVTVTACVLDANLIGRQFKVRGPLNKSATTAYRMSVDDTNGFGEA